jgi:hypothetical protein
VIEGSRAPRVIAANRSAFASLLNVRELMMASETLRLDRVAHRVQGKSI